MEKQHPLTFDDQVQIGRALQRIAKMIDRELSKAAGGKRVPFSLYTWGGHRAQYVSNAPRQDVKACMVETIARWNEAQDLPPHRWNS